MSVVYSGNNQWGPCYPVVAGGTSGIALSIAVPDPTSLTVARTDPQTNTGNVVSQNTGRTATATQTLLTPRNGPQSGSPAVTNVSAMTLSGYAPGTTQVTQFTGAYQSK